MRSTRPAMVRAFAAHVVQLCLLAAIALLAAVPVQAQSLYRCVGSDSVATWQDAPCPDGVQESVRQYDPALAGTPEQAARLEEQRARDAEAREQLRKATARSSRRRPPRARARDTAHAACEQARHLARLRSDESGHRVPARTIRTREQQARETCRRR